MPIPENPHFQSKGDRQHDSMLSAWPERLWSDSWSSLSWHEAACRPAHPQLLQACPGCSGVLAASLPPILQVPGVSPAHRCGNQKCPFVVLRVPFGTKLPLRIITLFY